MHNILATSIVAILVEAQEIVIVNVAASLSEAVVVLLGSELSNLPSDVVPDGDLSNNLSAGSGLSQGNRMSIAPCPANEVTLQSMERQFSFMSQSRRGELSILSRPSQDSENM